MWFLHFTFAGVPDAKSYVIVSQLPAEAYKKYVEDSNTSHLTGFAFVIIGIVYLAGGKISEGILSKWIILCFVYFN